jgi:IS30 family transposase
MQGEKVAFRPCAYAEGALTHHGQTLVPGGDRLYLRLEGGDRCVVEPADYSTVRSVAAALDLPEAGPQGQVRRHQRSKRPKTRGKIRISHTVKERLKQTDERSRLREGADDTLIGVGPVCLLVLADRAVRLLAARRCYHDSGSVSKAEVGLLQGRPLKTLTPKWGKQLAGHTGLTEAL